MKKSGARKLFSKVFLSVSLLIGAAFAGLPALWMLSGSFKGNSEIFAYPPTLISEGFSLGAYRKIFGDPAKLRFFFNSYLVSISVTLLTLFVAIMAAYAFSRYEFRFKKQINMAIIGFQSVPTITFLIPFFSLILTLKLYNTYWALIFTYLMFTLPYAVIMMTGYFNTLPREIDEAVKIDGGGSFVTLWRILVPISLPGIVSVGIYTFMQAWNEYLYALTLTRTNDMRTVPIGISLLMGQHSYSWNEMLAMSILGCLPVLILFLFFQQFFIGDMTSGSVKI